MAESGALDGSVVEALVANNVRSSYTAIVGVVIEADSIEGAIVDVTSVAGFVRNIDAPGIPPHWWRWWWLLPSHRFGR